MRLKAVAFDAYGTLLDVYSVGELADQIFPENGQKLANIWRDKQIEYSRLRTMCNKYVSFWEITGDSLRFAANKLNLDMTTHDYETLMDQYARLSAFEENYTVLNALRILGLPLAVLSNGNPGMICSALEAAGLDNLFDHVLSADQVKAFKTSPKAYQLGPDTFDCQAKDILFVSSNGWDICGATWFGYTTFWVNRADNPQEELGVSPHGVGRCLRDLPAFAQSLM